MIGPVSSASFASYGTQRHHSHGERPPSATDLQEDAFDPQNTLRSNESKEQEGKKTSNPQELDAAEKEQVEKLKQRDAEVRAHEQAHMAAAGSLAMGGPNYVYQTGPDGRQYAIGGNVKIDTSPGRTPEETERKAQQIRAAALAPSDPSPQDLKVAAAASSMEMEAAAKEAGKTEKEAGRFASKADASNDSDRGEITSSRQVFAASPSDSEEDASGEENSEPRPNPYLALASQIYGKQQ
ncbi:hypothetical protein IEN85_20225 [Pelagicoccus sp. NFK12]|uniref:SprA-related family protein n=1 Tax=Pelagicoccus enzymogenes TaxID=2773457 RepID=A0A927FBK2_9BACT|nr:putative metalloprotease CJM1_0395 family protein [Pelagicoccus enzymogenes]MBD5781839.1 hypothetical protein [Pelagicoccus enzymogenes]